MTNYVRITTEHWTHAAFQLLSFPNIGTVYWLFWIHQLGSQAVTDFTSVKPRLLWVSSAACWRGHNGSTTSSHICTPQLHMPWQRMQNSSTIRQRSSKRWWKSSEQTIINALKVDQSRVEQIELLQWNRLRRRSTSAKENLSPTPPYVWRLNPFASFYAPAQALSGRRH